MRRSMVLMLVLGFAAGADAGLTFTVNGVEQPEEITLRQSEAVSLGIELYTGSLLYPDLDYILSNAQAEFIWDGYIDDYGNEFGPIEFPAPFEVDPGLLISEPQRVTIGAYIDLFTLGYQNSSVQSPIILGGPVLAPATIMTDLVLHCLEPTDVILEIISNGIEIDFEFIPPGTVLHTLTIHQIPEPMTIALLGLGGLFALRRKK